MEMIPKRFIRIWVGGSKAIPNQFNIWWEQFREMHPDYEFISITKLSQLNIPNNIKPIVAHVIENGTCAGLADILRLVAVYDLGGVYIDTDVMPLKSFDPLIISDKPFLAKRSSKSFESAVIGSPKCHPAILETLNAMPKWYMNHIGRSASIQSGPAFVSSVLFGRKDVTHLPIKAFYPYNGFGSPKREQKIKMFANKNNFPNEMYAAHFSNHRWGGSPKGK
jgi:mannosyltransferase OCH1-like enzyme